MSDIVRIREVLEYGGGTIEQTAELVEGEKERLVQEVVMERLWKSADRRGFIILRNGCYFPLVELEEILFPKE